MTRECISRILELTEILPSFKTGFSLVNAAVEDDCTNGFVIMVFDESDQVAAGFVLLHCCPQSCMPNPVEGLLEVHEGLAGAGDISHRGFSGRTSALWSSFLL